MRFSNKFKIIIASLGAIILIVAIVLVVIKNNKTSNEVVPVQGTVSSENVVSGNTSDIAESSADSSVASVSDATELELQEYLKSYLWRSNDDNTEVSFTDKQVQFIYKGTMINNELIDAETTNYSYSLQNTKKNGDGFTFETEMLLTEENGTRTIDAKSVTVFSNSKSEVFLFSTSFPMSRIYKQQTLGDENNVKSESVSSKKTVAPVTPTSVTPISPVSSINTPNPTVPPVPPKANYTPPTKQIVGTWIGKFIEQRKGVSLDWIYKFKKNNTYTFVQKASNGKTAKSEKGSYSISQNNKDANYPHLLILKYKQKKKTKKHRLEFKIAGQAKYALIFNSTEYPTFFKK